MEKNEFNLKPRTRCLCFHTVQHITTLQPLFTEGGIYPVLEEIDGNPVIRDNFNRKMSWAGEKQLFENYFVTLTE